jgi:hypothetical protein
MDKSIVIVRAGFRLERNVNIDSQWEMEEVHLMTNELNKNYLYWMNEQNSTTCYTHFNCTTYTAFALIGAKLTTVLFIVSMV